MTPSKAKIGFKKAKKLIGIKPLKDKADRSLQDYYRAKYPDEKCESCGKQFQVMHHFVEKSQSTGLRFEPKNLIFLCYSCHFRHHRTGDSMIMGEVLQERGLEWLISIKKMKLERKGWQLDRPFLTKYLTYYQSKLKTLE